ncbi:MULTISPECIES: hypothetical protein [unclassified Marinovum]
MKLAEETIPKGEAADIQALVAQNLKTVWTDGNTAKRGQHGKHHGLVEGVFRVANDLPAPLAQGVFQPGAAYRCHVRFSNGGTRDDTEQDVRGMAIKLYEIAGQKLMPGKGHVAQQDFILVDSPTYFSATMADYRAFNRHFTPLLNLRGNGLTPLRLLRAVLGGGMLLAFHRKTFTAAKAFVARNAGSPLALTYHSTVPYLLGNGQAVKYTCTGHGRATPTATTPDGLRNALWSELGEHAATFDFGVVIQSDPAAHPVENPMVDWEQAGARYVKIAELTLPQQSNTAAKDMLAESLAFSPWMSLPAHRPLGFINRARREIYRAMSGLRHRRTKDDAP